MSFKVNYGAVSICNGALAMLAEAPITSLEGTNLASRLCNLFYARTVRMLLEKCDWGLASTRETLVVMDTDRVEWAYRFAAPANLAYAIRATIPVGGNTVQGYASNGIMYTGSSFDVPFSRLGDFIYANVEELALDFTTLDITEDKFTEDFVLVLEAYLRARLAPGITKDMKLAKDLSDYADVALNGAIARFRNQQNPQYNTNASETDRVRTGGFYEQPSRAY